MINNTNSFEDLNVTIKDPDQSPEAIIERLHELVIQQAQTIGLAAQMVSDLKKDNAQLKDFLTQTRIRLPIFDDNDYEGGDGYRNKNTRRSWE